MYAQYRLNLKLYFWYVTDHYICTSVKFWWVCNTCWWLLSQSGYVVFFLLVSTTAWWIEIVKVHRKLHSKVYCTIERNTQVSKQVSQSVRRVVTAGQTQMADCELRSSAVRLMSALAAGCLLTASPTQTVSLLWKLQDLVSRVVFLHLNAAGRSYDT